LEKGRKMQNRWPTTKLEEFLTERNEKPNLDEVLNGKIPIVAKIGFDTGKIELREERKTKTNMILIRPCDLVISGINAAKGAIAIYERENATPAAATIHYSSYIINEQKVDSFYIWYFMRSHIFRKILISSLPGGIKTEAKPKRLLPIEIPLPPIEEQKQIVAKIRFLEARIEETKRVRQETVKETEELFESAVEELFSDMNLVEKRRLSMLTSKIGSGSTPKGGRRSYPTSGVPFIRSMNIRMREFQWDGIAFISKATHDAMNGTKVKPNDVLLNITGASIGRVACAPADLVEANVNQHVSIIRPLETLNPRYLMYWLSQTSIQNLIQETQKGETREGLTKAQIELFDIPVPPITEQVRIVTYLDLVKKKVDELRKLQGETEEEMEELVPSILDKAFNGEL
jgi:type I restriction enzyme S subunit